MQMLQPDAKHMQPRRKKSKACRSYQPLKKKYIQSICKIQRPFRGDDGAHGMQTTSSQTTQHIARLKNLIATKAWTYEVFQGSVKSRMESCLGCKTSTGKHTNFPKQHQESREPKIMFFSHILIIRETPFDCQKQKIIQKMHLLQSNIDPQK